MSAFDILSLFVIMLTLAAIPSASVALVVTRSATLTISNGIAVSVGIVVGDLVFILLAILGLSVVATNMAWLFMGIKYLGAAYLIWLGTNLLFVKSSSDQLKDRTSVDHERPNGKLITSFLAGFLLTLGDIKALFFYVSLFPTFVNLSTLTIADIVIIVLLTIVTVGGVKVFYAYSAHKVVALSQNSKLNTVSRKTAGGFMLGVGGYIIAKT